jgi:hypothetical protein
MIRRFAAPLLILAACGRPPEAPRAGADSTVGRSPAPLAWLGSLAGQYPADAALWAREPLRTRMTRLLGGDYEAFLRNLQTSGPVSVEDGLVFVTGNCPSSEKAWGAAVLVADPAADRLLLKMYSEQWDSVRTWEEGAFPVLPRDVMTVLAGWTERMEQARKPAPARKAEKKKEPG